MPLNRASIKMEYFVFDSENIDMDSVHALKNNPCIAFVVLHRNPDEIFNELVKFNKPIVKLILSLCTSMGLPKLNIPITYPFMKQHKNSLAMVINISASMAVICMR